MNNNFAESNDPATRANQVALLAWEERQRRQRTLRLLMMFLMALLLMDGDESPDQRNPHRRKNSVRRNSKGYSMNGRNSSGGKRLIGLGELITPLKPEVFRARREQDQLLLETLRRNHPRWKELLEKNGGRDVEGIVSEWVRQKISEESRQMTHKNGNLDLDAKGEEAVKNFTQGNQDMPSLLPTMERSAFQSDLSDELVEQKTASEGEIEQLDDLPVFHYPRNVTGRYLGHWMRLASNFTTIFDEHKSSNYGEEVEMDRSNNDSQSIDSPSVVTIEEVQPWVESKLTKRKDDVALMLLPPNVYLNPQGTSPDLDARNNNSSILFKRPIGKDLSALASSPPSLPLTNDFGRAVFQFFSRPVPAMNELSVIDGHIKLYDVMPANFFWRRTDVVLRVKGVMLHGIGRMSLVTTRREVGERSVFGVRQRLKKTNMGRIKDTKHNGEVNDINYFGLDDESVGEENFVPDTSEQHRKLLERGRNLLNLSKNDKLRLSKNYHNSDSDGLGVLKQIRDDAIELYLSHNNPDEGSSEEEANYLPKSIKRQGWTLFQSIDESDFSATGSADFEKTITEGTIHRQLALVDESRISRSGRPSSDSLNDTTSYSEKSPLASSFNGLHDNFDSVVRHSDMASIQENSSDFEVDKLHYPSSASSFVFPFPYVHDDPDDSLMKMPSPSKRSPSQDESLRGNAEDCEFEINIDVKEEQWNFGELRASMEHRLRAIHAFNPLAKSIQSQDSKDETEAESPVFSEVKQSHFLFRSQPDFMKQDIPKEAVVMTMSGNIESPNCHFNSFVNVTAIRTNLDHTTTKAINYSFYMMLTCLTQIIVLLRQLLHTQAQSAASNVSLLCIGWQTVLDAILCISHIFLCMVMSPLFTAFASVAFFKLLIFCVIEMKYMAIIIQARNNSNSSGNTQEELRRQMTLLHLKFYGALMSAIIVFWYFGPSHKNLFVLLLYSFWVPQIILNIVTESRKPMHPYYIYGMSLTRSVAPLYVFAVPNNFLKELEPDFPTDFHTCKLLVLWIGVQTAFLVAQGKYGTRFMIPQRFLPPKFDYSRPIPQGLLPRPSSIESSSNRTLSEIELGPLINQGGPSSRDRSTTGVARNRRGGGSRKIGSSVEEINGTMSTETADAPTLDCVICYNPINIDDRTGYMLAPCDHIFHRRCLEQWMDVKMECPICRKDLPSL